MTTTTTVVEHGITVNEVQLPAGRPFRASCLCGWESGIVRSRPHAIAVGQSHVEGVDADAFAYPAGVTSPQLRESVEFLLEQMRQAAWDEGYEEALSTTHSA